MQNQIATFMLRNQKIKQTLLTHLKRLAQKINQAITQLSFQKILVVYKKLSQQIMHLLKYFYFFLLKDNKKNQQNQFTQPIKLLSILIQASEFVKYGHLLSGFKFVVQKYQKFTKNKICQVNQERIFKRMDKNQHSEQFKKLQNIQLFHDMLNTCDYQQFFQKLQNKQITLQNTDCICCTQIFFNSFQAQNKNLKIQVIVEMTKQQIKDKTLLLKQLCAVSNSGGGILLVDGKRQNNILKPKGIKFENRQQIAKLQAKIKKKVTQIKYFNFIIDRVRICDNFLNCKNKNQHEKRICLRIIVIPQNPKRISHLQFTRQNYQKYYEVYKFDSQFKPIKVLPQNLYNFLLERKYSNNKIQNSHKNINCIRPHAQYSKMWLKKPEQQQNANIQYSSSQEQVTQLQDQPKFKYKYSSLIVINSQKSERQVIGFSNYLERQKIIFEMSKPFQHLFNGLTRQVYLITHEKTFYLMKYLLKQSVKQRLVKANQLILMPVEKILQIDKSQFSEAKCNYLIEKFNLRYKKMLSYSTQSIIVKQTGKKKQVYQLILENFCEAIYAYMVFEQLYAKPYFIKEKTLINISKG